MRLKLIFRTRIVFNDDFNTMEGAKFTLDEYLKYRNAICTSFAENIGARNPHLYHSGCGL